MEKIKKIIESVGPGFILASVMLGPGSITVASRIGSEHGFSFLWVIVMAAIAMVVYTSMGARFGVTHKEFILQSVSDTYGRWFAIIIGIASFLSASSFQFGNNLGVGIALREITGIYETVWPLIFTPLAILLVFWAKKLYKVLEKMMMVIVMVMIIAFVTNLIFIQPNFMSIAKGFLSISFSWEHFDIVAAMVGTTFALHCAIYQAYLVQDKKWELEQLKKA